MLSPGEIDPFCNQVQSFLIRHYGNKDGRQLWQAGQGIHKLDERVLFYSKLVEDTERLLLGQKPEALANLIRYKWEPVDIETFIKDPYYLNKQDEVWPAVLAELKECNTPGKYHEAVFTGGIGSAKSYSSVATVQYQLYRLSCLENPHEAFGLDKTDEILFIFQSITRAVSQNSYDRFRTGIEQSPYFKQHFPWDKDITSQMDFPRRISVIPASGKETALIGRNVIGGLIDELNYMAVVSKSKQSVDAGTYDQAVALYNSIARRRKSRFSTSGANLPGMLCLASSKRYPGQFTDLKEAEARKEIAEKGSTSIFIYDYCVWDLKPPDKYGNPPFSKERFEVFAGDEYRRPRILEPGEREKLTEEDQEKVRSIPVEFRRDFEIDIINALRELAGVSTLARHPYLVNTEAVTAMFKKEQRSIFSTWTTDFTTDKVAVLPSTFVNPKLPRFAHVDLAITGDCAGLAIGTVVGFKSMAELMGGSEKEMMPIIRYDGTLEIRPPKMGEILFHKIRELLTVCRKLGLNIRWVTYDSFQSRDSIQMLRQQGFISGETSVDRTPLPYDFFKGAIYTGRVSAPVNPKARKELASLEKDTKTGKIDHPPNGSKDVADAMAAVAYGLTIRREIWGMYKISPMAIPPSVRSSVSKQDDKTAKEPVRRGEVVEVLA